MEGQAKKRKWGPVAKKKGHAEDWGKIRGYLRERSKGKLRQSRNKT